MDILMKYKEPTTKKNNSLERLENIKNSVLSNIYSKVKLSINNRRLKI